QWRPAPLPGPRAAGQALRDRQELILQVGVETFWCVAWFVSSWCGGSPQIVLVLECTPAGDPWVCPCAHLTCAHGHNGISSYTNRAVSDQNVTRVGIPDQPQVVAVSHLPITLPVCTSERHAGRPSPMPHACDGLMGLDHRIGLSG